MIRAGLLVAALAAATAGPVAAQVDSTPRPKRGPPTPTDSAVRDSAAADTAPTLLPTFAEPIVPGPLPRGARYTFTADSLVLTNARTLSDLLGHLPGVYVARGGWYGQAEPVVYGGRGPSALEVYWDGVPYRPIGRDSLYLDPARIPLAPLERVDVVVLPALLQVYLVTARQRSTAPATQVGILTGAGDITGYRAGYATRTRRGFGVAMVADWNNLDGNPATSTTTFSTQDMWLKAEYVPPGGRLGVSAQLLSSSWQRHPSSTAGLVDHWRTQRRDEAVRAFVASRGDGLGFRLEAGVARTRTEKDTAVAPRYLYQAALEAGHTWTRAQVTAAVRRGENGAPSTLEARGGWTLPGGVLTVAGWVRHASYAGDRSGDRAHLTAGLTLPLEFSTRAEVAWMRDVQAPLLVTDAVRQTATDVAAWVRWEHPRALIEVGRGRRDPFVPIGFPLGIKPVDHVDSTPRTEFLAARAMLRPVSGIELSAWYFDPVVGGGDFEPPHHARASATFNSKFWRVFRSGVFRLRGELAVESWSRSVAGGGRDTSDVPRYLGGATFVETNLELQLVGVTIFWIVRNANGMRGAYVEGLGHPKSTQMYGVRWLFTN